MKYDFASNANVFEYLKKKGYSKIIITNQINYLLEKWDSIISEYEQIKNIMFEEYLNDLDKRYLIDKILDFYDVETKEEILIILKKADECFVSNSDELISCVLGKKIEEKLKITRRDNWYFYRLIKYDNAKNWIKYFPILKINEII
jgi:hypothetical protein